MPRSVPRVRGSAGPSVGGEARVTGANELADLAKALRQAGAKDLRKELYKGLRSSAKPLIADARKNARATLPKHGGLNVRVARSKFKVSTRGGGVNPGVRITATGVDKRVDTQGRVWHPVYGRRRPGEVQRVEPGWFTKPMQAGAPAVRQELVAVIERIAKQLEG